MTLETRVGWQEAVGPQYYAYVDWDSNVSIRTGRAAPHYTVDYVHYDDGRPVNAEHGTLIVDAESGFLFRALRAAGYAVRRV